MSCLPHRRFLAAFTLVELLVVVAVVALLVALIAPASRRARTTLGDEISATNLAALAQAHAMYAADWDDRQVQWIPDDAGAAGSCFAYVPEFGCPPPIVLGWQGNSLWQYALGCGGNPGGCNNWVVYQPAKLLPSNTFGSFRLANAKAFHDYVDGKFYSTKFFAPLDYVTWEKAKIGVNTAGEFLYFNDAPNIVFASYCLSPAAMWHPDVLSANPASGLHWTDPDTLAQGYTSPTASKAAFPELKTRMIEHNWCADPPSDFNPGFSGNYTPWFFNAGIAATPVALFFDGHVAELPNAKVVGDDEKLLESQGFGLWSRDTPLGAAGYYGGTAIDGTKVSHHVLTIDGILGRDMLSAATR